MKISDISSVFTPGAPVDTRDLFAGRINQMQDVIVALRQKGQHVVIYGERGVGKTSLANVLHLILGGTAEADPNPMTTWGLGCATINCDASDDFTSIWRKVFRELSVNVKRRGFGFSSDEEDETFDMSSLLPEGSVSPDDVRFAIARLPRPATIIIDEIDTIDDEVTTRLMAHTIKNLSDHALPTKIIIVGVADSVDDLIAEHRSVERSLVQVRMPRMSTEELYEILDKALGKVSMSIDEEAKRVVAMLSQGLPHYTHLLGLHAAISAATSRRNEVTIQDVYFATIKAVDKSPQSILDSYLKATSSPRQINLHAKVLLACALAATDEMGMFSATQVRGPLFKLTNKNYESASFQRHLDDFCDDNRGPILRQNGAKRRYRYRFINPMMPPFVVMQGIKSKLLDNEALQEFILDRRLEPSRN